jgi:2',3'-cyclic-nucleotide 2'-phosphodiesterase (5'-nucleotidase family)
MQRRSRWGSCVPRRLSDSYAAFNPDNTIRVHAGDMVGASPLISSYFHDEPTIKATNLMEFDVGTIGNHEFDEGGQEMLRLIKGGQRNDGLQFKEDSNGKLVVEGFALGTAFETVNLTIDRSTGDIVEASARVVPTCNENAEDPIAPDPETAALVAEHNAQVTEIENRVVGTASEDITRTATAAGESALGDLIADAQRTYAGTQIASMNPGGIRADIQQGPITYGELFTVQPFDNQVVKMELTGDQIYRLLEQQFEVNRMLQISGFTYTYNASNPAGQRITSVTINGAPLDRNATYTVAANGFIATGGDGFTVFEEASDTQETLGNDLDALEAYIGSQQQVGVPADFGRGSPSRDSPRRLSLDLAGASHDAPTFLCTLPGVS